MRSIILLLSFIICFSLSAKEKTPVVAYFYHAKPPLLINQIDKQGLYFDFINYLNKHSDIYQFELVYMPRKRLDIMLENDALGGLVVGVNPIWFKDKNETKYFWTSRLFTDRDEVISLNRTPLTFMSPVSLHGKIFGGVRGFYYFGIDEAVNKNLIKRVDTADEISLFSMLRHQRIDAAVVSRSTFNYVVKKNDWFTLFHLSKKPHDIYDRRVLIPKSDHALYQHVEKIMLNMTLNQQWQITLEQYL